MQARRSRTSWRREGRPTKISHQETPSKQTVYSSTELSQLCIADCGVIVLINRHDKCLLQDKEEQERLAAEGRRLLKAAEAAADRGTTALDGFVAPAPARAGSFIRSMSAVGAKRV